MNEGVVIPCSAAFKMVSGGTLDSEEGEAGVGPPVVGGLESAKNRCAW